MPRGGSDEASREDQAAEDDSARLASRDAGQRLRLDQGASLVSAERPAARGYTQADLMEELGRQDLEIERLIDAETVLGYCPHGVNLDRDFCPEGCRV